VTASLELVLADDGSKATSAITVSVARVRGLSLSRARLKVARLEPAQKRAVRLRVRLTRRARVMTPVEVTVKAG
jgi:hypothetical protein